MTTQHTSDWPIAVTENRDGSFTLEALVGGRSRHATLAELWAAIDAIDAPRPAAAKAAA